MIKDFGKCVQYARGIKLGFYFFSWVIVEEKTGWWITDTHERQLRISLFN
jgi:hypothetical protein